MSTSNQQSKYHRTSQPSPGVLLLEFNRYEHPGHPFISLLISSPRPPLNAFHDAMWKELQSIIETISSDTDIRVIVLSSSSDKHFTAGLDRMLPFLTAGVTLTQILTVGALASLAAPAVDPSRKAFALHQHIIEFQNAISSLSACRQPVLAALHGSVLGLGVDIASACDVRFAATNATFGILVRFFPLCDTPMLMNEFFKEVNVGLAADIGTLQRFPKIVGNDSKARELALSGRRFDAKEALEIGFVSEVVEGGRKEVVEKALGLAKEIASKSPVAVVGTKHLLNHARDHTVQDGLEYTAAWNMAMLQSVDTTLAMKASVSKLPPVFPPLAHADKAKL
ncbi:hypothetical protein P7C73_g5842, partial [Tremellales sp. Uapishka_1]